MPFDLLSWIFVALLLIGVVGLVGTIIGDINRSVSKPTANALRVILIVLGLGGALGLGCLVFGVFLAGPSPHASPTGLNATGENGILTQGQKSGTTTPSP